MKNYSKALISLLCVLLTVPALTACHFGTGESSKATADEAVTESTSDETVMGLSDIGIDAAALGIEPSIMHDSHEIGFQLEKPEKGEQVAVLHTAMGDIVLRLFPQQAPKAVTNFINLAKDGKYNKTTFHRVINDFIVQGGHCGSDEDAVNGTSSYSSEFEDEFCDKLFNIRGAVSMVNDSRDSNGSQFFINQTNAEAFEKNGGWSAYEELWANIKTQLRNYKDSELLSAFIDENGDKLINTDRIPYKVKELYNIHGGSPNLDGVYNEADRGNTVFAQVIEGMSVVDKIAAVKVDDKNTPVDSVVIESVEITKYGG